MSYMKQLKEQRDLKAKEMKEILDKELDKVFG